MYAKWDNGILLVAAEAEDGYKIMTATEPPEVEPGYKAVSYWKEETAAWVQTWEVVEDVDEVDDSEALNILLGGGEE